MSLLVGTVTKSSKQELQQMDGAADADKAKVVVLSEVKEDFASSHLQQITPEGKDRWRRESSYLGILSHLDICL